MRSSFRVPAVVLSLVVAMILPSTLSAKVMVAGLYVENAEVVTGESASPVTNAWGIASDSLVTIPGEAFLPSFSGTTYSYSPVSRGRYRTSAAGTPYFDFWPDLPQGAEIRFVELEGCDTSTTHQAGVYLFDAVSPAVGFSSAWAVTSGVSAAPGCQLFRFNLPAGAYVNRSARRYLLRIELGAPNDTTSVAAVRIGYRLRVSPAPRTATYADVPTTHPFFQFIEALGASGITGGCSAAPLNFCPDAAVTRGQMAVFLSRALGLHFAN